jgi:hypothetical protein
MFKNRIAIKSEKKYEKNLCVKTCQFIALPLQKK